MIGNHFDIRNSAFALSSGWFRKDDDARWQFGLPSRGNANFAWVQHFIYHLAPAGMAGSVLANGSSMPSCSVRKRRS